MVWTTCTFEGRLLRTERAHEILSSLSASIFSTKVEDRHCSSKLAQ